MLPNHTPPLILRTYCRYPQFSIKGLKFTAPPMTTVPPRPPDDDDYHPTMHTPTPDLSRYGWSELDLLTFFDDCEYDP